MSSRLLHICFVSAALLLTAGCAHRTYYGYAPPPPPYAGQPPLIQAAERNGFQTGRADGANDAFGGRRFRAERTRAFRDTPGYDPNFGPFGPYRDAFRRAYLQGYQQGFNNPR